MPKMKRTLDLFCTLMYKVYKLQIRTIGTTITIIILPILFALCCLGLRILFPSEVKPKVIFPPFDCTDVTLTYKEIAYSPNNNQVNQIMEGVKNEMKVETKQFENGKEVQAYLWMSSGKLGVVFDDNLGQTTKLPKKINFVIRFPSEMHVDNNTKWHTSHLFPQSEDTGPRKSSHPKNSKTADPPYYDEGFLKVQYYISKSIIQMYKQTPMPVVHMQRFPFPSYVQDDLLGGLAPMIHMMLIFFYLFPLLSMIAQIVTEKEKQQTEAMKIMGLKNCILWTTRFLSSLFFMTISTTITVLILILGDVFVLCDGFILFILLEIYCCSIMALGFLICSFFNKANAAIVVAIIVCVLSMQPYDKTKDIYIDLSLGAKLAISLLPNSAFGYGVYLISSFERQGVGMKWDTLFDTYTPDDNLTLAYVILMLLVDTFLYFILAIYFDAIWPSAYGVQKKWYLFNCFRTRRVGAIQLEERRSSDAVDVSKFEPEPVGLKVGVDIRGLSKRFGKKMAVCNVNLRMYEDQITVLLGHNGAGKTTTMSILTGMMPPTYGTAIVNSFDICEDLEEVRKQLGLCAQHNILFDNLKVDEHIYFFCRLKGMSKAAARRDVNAILEDFALEDFKNEKSRNLSGGYKRKLCVALAFCGGSKIVILDEPTAGMDPAARRVMWSAIESRKKGRVILLTTHYMDEADILGDRIAIMAEGEVLCCGSSFFLKKAYGAGYNLTIEKADGCDVQKVTAELSKYIPTIAVQSQVGTELCYLLSEDQVNVFEKMLGDLEAQSQALKVVSYGISLTKLEEVFMRIGAADRDRSQKLTNSTLHSSVLFIRDILGHIIGAVVQKDMIRNTKKLKSGWKLFLNHFLAMLYKRYYYALRTWILFFSQFALTWLLTLLTFLRSKQPSDTPAKMEISLSKYNAPVTVISGDPANPMNTLFQSGLDWLNKNHQEVWNIGDVSMETEILKYFKQSEINARRHYLVGATYTTDSITSWFNNEPYHTPPLALNLAMNSILRLIKPDSELVPSNYPLPYTAFPDSSYKSTYMTLPIVVAFIGGFTITFYINERICKAKHLQYTSGVNLFVFWMTSYLWDWVIYIITALLVIITALCLNVEAYTTSGDISRLLIVFILTGFELLPFLYLFALAIDSPAKGFCIIFMMLLLLGPFGIMMLAVLDMLIETKTDITKIVFNVLDGIMVSVPSFFLGTSLKYMDHEHARLKMCNAVVKSCTQINPEEFCWEMICNQNSYCCKQTEGYFDYEKPGILRFIYEVVFWSAFYYLLFFFIEFDVFSWIINLCARMCRSKVETDEEEDDDVQKEAQRIRDMPRDEIAKHSLVIKDVRKVYSCKKTAVAGVNLAVEREECFGLLGVNGAGKTTTFKMITGEFHPSSGRIHVCGYNTKTNMSKIYKLTGYCPQFDAVLETLTAKETLVMYAMIRGYRLHDCKSIAQQMALDFNFNKHFNTRVGQMSGGNKRKLSTALAFLGDPNIIFLDEPTAGMDPVAMRYIWGMLHKARAEGKCLILSSHSMEECEALCTRLAIMVDGRLKCIGSIQHLTNRFSQGYTLTVKATRSVHIDQDVDNIVKYIKSHIPSAVVKERQSEYLSLHILDTTIPCSKLFGILQRAKAAVNIDDYSLSQSSLEQVFLSFTK